jgi:hypothetical protein
VGAGRNLAALGLLFTWTRGTPPFHPIYDKQFKDVIFLSKPKIGRKILGFI